MISIYMTTWNRKAFTEKAINLIHERTTPNTFMLHAFDNGSDKDTRDYLYDALENKLIVSLHLDSRNTGCLYNKVIFHSMTEHTHKYYVVTDNDIYPPKLSPDWLSQMISIMDKYPKLALLTPQIPPQYLQGPITANEDIVCCKAVGNTFKMVRRNCFPELEPIIGQYGDDGLVSEKIRSMGYDTAFCKNIFCFHAGQCDDWGYKKEEINDDPRKSGYGLPFKYNIINGDTYEPESKWKI